MLTGMTPFPRAQISGWAFCLLAVSLFPSASSGAFADALFRAGAATGNISPHASASTGEGRSMYVHDELHARALVLDDGQVRLGFVVCDNVGIPRVVFDRAKALAHRDTGIPPEHLMLSSTHTHSAVSAREGDDHLVPAGSTDPLSGYQEFVALRIADALTNAVANLEPARIGWGSGQEPGQVFNRRWFLEPGSDTRNPFGGTDTVRMNPPPNMSHLLVKPAGPTDPEVSFISVQSLSGRPIALLANYSLHYVGGIPAGHVSADYFAAFADRIRHLLGADHVEPAFVGIMSNGTSGDVNNINFRGSREPLEPYQKIKQVANIVAAEVFKAYQSIEHHDWVRLDARYVELPLKTRRVTPEFLEWAHGVRDGSVPATHPRTRGSATRILQLAEHPLILPIPLQAFRIGELGVMAIPIETLVEIGLDLKRRSPFPAAFTISLANGWYGYLPTPEQHKLGGYETWLGTNRFEPDASVKISDQLIQMLQEMR